MEYLNLFSNCQLVKGANRTLICDLQMQKSYPVSNDVAGVLHFLKDHSIEECIHVYGAENEEAIISYVNFITDKEMGFIDNRIVTGLSALDLSWDAFSDITNVIIEFNENLDYNNRFFNTLFNLNVSALEIRCYQNTDLEKLEKFINIFNGSVLNYIKLILPYSAAIDTEWLETLAKKNLRIRSFLFHSAPEDKTERIYKNTVQLTYYSKAINDCLACGLIRQAYFSTNMELFTESMQHNTCLNRKLSIDFNGLVKNCPSMQHDYGYMFETDLTDLLADNDFSKYWNIRKEDIEVCKDCEYRNVCTDCRAYTEQSHANDLGLDVSKPLKCGYNPYNNEWDEWSTNPLKQKAIQFYGMQQLVKTHEA
ncbi:grasp-with-spasm system SPASM domain peptide maturase [Pedobacter sp. UBA5917]|jgi:SPASM domain peptide maturase of grasp-with-spasm system|uniref:grasp-with-spasm system SPASM domain peptide maturase n=1 Tax=Pedobacter sp. UBA5917 TaxID=1947061 RepID=UPI0025F92F3B|nr:grasp-with-spasm system SPASM domain peptide maturase [Pedobacter sp. UBA5917]